MLLRSLSFKFSCDVVLLLCRMLLCRTKLARLNLSRLLLPEEETGELEDERESDFTSLGDGDRLRLLDLFWKYFVLINIFIKKYNKDIVYINCQSINDQFNSILTCSIFCLLSSV